MTYAIRFEFPDGGTFYAGMYKGAFGWAPTLKTALFYDTPDDAMRVLKNAYGTAAGNYGRVIRVKDGGPSE